MNNSETDSGTASIPVTTTGRRPSMDISGQCLTGTVQALLDDDGDARMLPEHRDVAISEAARFSQSILEAYVSHYGEMPNHRLNATTSVPSSVPTGLLYGCVQSGKTRAITLTSAILFDNGIRIVIVLTSNNVELVSQTAQRLRLVDDVQFLTSLDEDEERWERDVNHIASYVRDTGLLVVCQKERHHQQRLISFLRAINAGGLPAVVFDDEADQATPDTTLAARSAGRSNAPAFGSTTYRLTMMNDNAQQLGESIIESLSRSLFVQVTATPYALLLQHTRHPLRPKFTCLIEPGEGYLGGDFFFPAKLEVGEASPPIIEVPAAEANALAVSPLAAPPEMLRRAIAYFCLSAAAHELHSRKGSKHGYSFLCHTSARRADHDHLERLISTFLDHIGRDLELEISGDVVDAFSFAQRELRKTAPELLSGIAYTDIKRWIIRKLRLRSLRVINSDSDTLAFTPGLNFFIGGNILGRGLTIKRLLVTYYMRNARSTQMDTMLQHARMFGYRGEHATLLRVFLPRTAIQRFVQIVKAEKDLRALMKSSPSGAIPVRVASNLNATRRNILDTGNLDAYGGGEFIYPYEPEYSSDKLGSTTERITSLLEQRAFRGPICDRTATEIDWDTFEEIVRTVRVKDSDNSRWLPSAIINVIHAFRREDSDQPVPAPLLWTRKTDRKGPELLTGVAGGDDPSPRDSAYSGRVILMLFRSPGDPAQNWSGAPFWYPTVVLPSQAGMFLFSANE